MSIYDDMRAVATDVFAEFKQGVVQYVGVTVDNGAAPDEADEPDEDVPITVNATVRPVSSKYVDGTTVVRTDKQITISNDGLVEPTMAGFFTVDGVRHKIIDIMPRPAAGEPIVWTVIVRR